MEDAREAGELEKIYLLTLFGVGAYGMLPVLAANDPPELPATREAVLSYLVAGAYTRSDFSST